VIGLPAKAFRPAIEGYHTKRGKDKLIRHPVLLDK
jgi:hypothetical protein